MRLKVKIALIVCVIAVIAALGFSILRHRDAKDGWASRWRLRKERPSYWYDPMRPAEHFDKPGKSPFMDMQLVPKCPPKASTAASGRPARSPSANSQYWYDPMHPAEHFDKPGKSPFMDMQLVPKYVKGGAAEDGSCARQVRLRLTRALCKTSGFVGQKWSRAVSHAWSIRSAPWVSTNTASKPCKCASQGGSSDSTCARPAIQCAAVSYSRASIHTTS